jgi:serine phosphatase RsbU (regulator of sigma subunit)/DNA-binding response OmpR family regulator/anti-sigma regulatory factor (Ser/Thr protein kinase)
VSQAPPRPLDAPLGADADGTTVLLVDDRRENLVALRAVLEPLAVPITTARSGDEALRLLLAEEFALILLDVQMPGMDGFSTAAMIKQHPRTSQIPIIFLTAFDERLDGADVGYSTGAVDYLAKPFDPQILRSKVRVFLDLHRKGQLLERQTRQLEAHVDELQRSRAALADAQRLARLGSWALDRATGRVRGSEQLHHVLDLPVDEPLPPADELFALVRTDTGAPLPELLRTASGRISTAGTLALRNGRVRHVVVHAEPSPDGGRPAVVGTIQDVTEQREAAEALARARTELHRERELVDLLQQAVAPADVPELAELDIATSYRPAGPGVVGGDWYDVLPLPDGTVVLVIGDVAGHGLPAASAMAQIRTALRVVLLRHARPGALLAELDRFLRASDLGTFATMAIVRLDPGTGECTLASAGHVPPLVRGDEVELLQFQPGPPLGSGLGSRYPEATATLAPGAALVLYTDGLIERRDEVIDVGLERLRTSLAAPSPSSAALVARVLEELVDDRHRDDVALLIARRREPSTRLAVTLPAVPTRLAQLRLTVARWVASIGAAPEQADDLVLAVGELATNVCLHAYPPFVQGVLHLEGELGADDVVCVVVRDEGRWREQPSPGGGRGLPLLRALGLEVEHRTDASGTTAALRTPLRRGEAPGHG